MVAVYIISPVNNAKNKKTYIPVVWHRLLSAVDLNKFDLPASHSV